MHGAPQAFVEKRRRNALIRPPPQTALGRAMATKQSVQIADVENEPHYFDAPPGYSAVVLTKLSGARTVLAVPMLKENEPIGAIVIWRTEVRPFTDKQIALVENFASQAVIAIENTRLLNELRESLQQQTATADVLKIISSSPGQLTPVFNSMLENAVRICGAGFGTMFLFDGNRFDFAADYGTPPALVELQTRRGPTLPPPGGILDRVMRDKQVAHSADYLAEQPQSPPVALGGARSAVAVPMLKDDQLVGGIVIYHKEVRPFSEKEIDLVKNFATQAVIAIENTRLLNELRQRTGDLSEALEQQTATSEVLKVISSSPGQLELVFNTMLSNATRICDAKFGMIFQFDGETFRCMAEIGSPRVFAEFLKQQGRFQPLKGSHLDRLMRTKQVSHTVDYAAEGIPSPPVKFGGARSTVDVPMLKDNELVGAFSIYRQEVRPFTDKQIALLTNFAAQAVIAIENARLLDDLNKLNQQLEQRVTDQVSEIERMSKLRRFLPPQVADLIVASGAEKQLESHRREITALFCDLRGFTGFSESSDPEDVMALLREYHASIGEIINKYGGTLERYAGDGVMVVFNDPIPVDNPALQAVLMAIEMRAAIGELIEKWRKLGHDIGFGIGIAHGFATLGTIGFEGRFDYAAIGTVSNVASRLCDEAKPGQILISSRVLMAVEKNITVEAVGDFALKGIRRPLTAYNVLATKAPD